MKCNIYCICVCLIRPIYSPLRRDSLTLKFNALKKFLSKRSKLDFRQLDCLLFPIVKNVSLLSFDNNLLVFVNPLYLYSLDWKLFTKRLKDKKTLIHLTHQKSWIKDVFTILKRPIEELVIRTSFIIFILSFRSIKTMLTKLVTNKTQKTWCWLFLLLSFFEEQKLTN